MTKTDLLNNYPKHLDALKEIDVKTSHWAWCEDRWVAEELKQYIIRLALGEGKIFGFVAIKIVGSAIHIHKLAVHPKYQRKRIGSNLLKDVEGIAERHGIKMIATIVWEHDLAGINWLIRKGFRASGISSSLYPDGSDGYKFYKVPDHLEKQ